MKIRLQKKIEYTTRLTTLMKSVFLNEVQNQCKAILFLYVCNKSHYIFLFCMCIGCSTIEYASLN